MNLRKLFLSSSLLVACTSDPITIGAPSSFECVAALPNNTSLHYQRVEFGNGAVFVSADVTGPNGETGCGSHLFPPDTMTMVRVIYPTGDYLVAVTANGAVATHASGEVTTIRAPQDCVVHTP